MQSYRIFRYLAFYRVGDPRLIQRTHSHVRFVGSVSSSSTGSKKNTQQSTVMSTKYCANCGRLISSNHRNFAERKYCSKSCSSTKLTAIDQDLENLFVNLAKAHGQVDCGDVQQRYEEEHTHQPDADSVHTSETEKQKAGMDAAKWRERVRRAGRRVVAQRTSSTDEFTCVQHGKPVEPSYAKGEWAVRWIKR